MLTLAFLLCGCGAELSQPTVPATEAPVETLPTEAPTLPPPETEPTFYEVTAQDAFYQLYTNPNNGRSYCVHIPRLVWNGISNLSVNEKIYSHHQRMLSTEMYSEEQTAVNSFWALGQIEGYASIISTFSPREYSHTFHSLFLVSTATGLEAADEEVLAAFGYTPESFREEIRRVLEENFEENNARYYSQSNYDDNMTRQLSDANLQICRPFIDPEGRLCATNFAYGFSVKGGWYYCLCLETGQPAIFNTTGCEHCS